jgi:hypothetical protein
MWVAASVRKITSNATGLDGIPVVLIKVLLAVDAACAYITVKLYPYFLYIPPCLENFQCCRNSKS